MRVFEEAVFDTKGDRRIPDEEHALSIRVRDSLGVTVLDASAIDNCTEHN